MISDSISGNANVYMFVREYTLVCAYSGLIRTDTVFHDSKTQKNNKLLF